MLQKFILLTITVLAGFVVRSQSNSLVIFSDLGNPFSLNVDGEKINTIPQSNIKAYGLTWGWHHVEINTVINQKEFFLKDSVLFVNNPKYINKEFTYALTDNGKRLSLEFKSVSEPSGPATPPVPEPPKIAAPVVDNNTYGNLYKAKNNRPVFFHNYDVQTSTCTFALNDKDIAYAVTLLKSCNDEDRKMGYVNDIVDFNCYTTAQLQQLLLTFTAEMDRLAIAKKAYLHISDKKNIPQLSAAFKYQTIKDNYTTYMEDQDNLAFQKKMQCVKPIEETKFNELYDKIKTAGYENEKLAVAKKVLVNVCLSTEQVKTVLTLFTHDREKLELLKHIYNVITDKENAKTLADRFQFTETKTDFLKVISN